MKKIIIALIAVIMIVSCLSIVACNKVDYKEIIDNYIFEQNGAVVTEDFVLPLSIAGEKASWSSNSAYVALEERSEDWLAKVSYPDSGTADVVLTLKIGKESKEFKVIVKAIDEISFMDNYKFSKNKATVYESFALDRTFEYKGKTCNITWSVDEEYELYLKISDDGNQCVVYKQSEPTSVNINATFEYQGTFATKSYAMSVYQKLEGLELVNYWYTNTDVSIDMSGYVVGIATAYSKDHHNVSLYMVNDDYTAGYYLYRVTTTDDYGVLLQPGVHVTVTGTTNTNYNGLIETNQGGNLVVDSDWPVDYDPSKAVKAIDEEIIGNLPSTIYNESRLVSLTNWKVKSVATDQDIADNEGKTFALLTITKGGVDVSLAVSKYMEGWYTNGSDAFKALIALRETYPVDSTLNVTGVLGYYKGWQINLTSANDVTKGGEADAADKKDYIGNKIAGAIEKVNAKVSSLGSVTVADKYTFDTKVDDVDIAYSVSQSSSVVINGGEFTITPGNPESTLVKVTYTVGDYSAVQFITIKSLIPTAASMIADLVVPSGISQAEDLPEAPEGATIEWKIEGSSENLKIVDGQLIPTLKDKKFSVTISATLTYEGVTRSKLFVVVVNAGKGAVAASAPFEADKPYYFALNQIGRSEVLYAKDSMNGYYIATDTDFNKASQIYIEKVGEDGYYLYFISKNDEKKDYKNYISAKVNGTHKNILLVDKDQCVWNYNAEHNCFTTPLTIDDKEVVYFIGTYGTFNTLSLNELTKIDKCYPAYLANIAFVPLSEYNITAEEVEHAEVELSKDKGINGERFVITVKVDDGYEIASVKVGGSVVEAVDGVYYGYVKGATKVVVSVSPISDGDEDDKLPEGNIAIINDGKYMTGIDSPYNDENQLKLSENASEALLLTIRQNSDGTVTFVTAEGKYLLCDGLNVKLVDTEGEHTLFVLEATYGGYFIRCNTANFNGNPQYLEVYSGKVTCYGMNASKANIYTFSFGKVDASQGGGESGGDEKPSDENTVTVSIADIATANSWENEKGYLSFTSGGVTFTAAGTPFGTYNNLNTGKFYTIDNSWRIYQNENPSLTITAPSGKKIVSVKITYASQQTGVILFNSANVESDAVVTVNAASAVFGVGNTDSEVTNGKARITAIVVVLDVDNTPPHVHTYSELVPAKSATCGDAGNVAYYTCTDASCGKYFDENKNEIDNVVIAPTYQHVDDDFDNVCDNCFYAYNELHYKNINILFGTKYVTVTESEYSSSSGSKKTVILLSDNASDAGQYMIRDNGDNTVAFIYIDQETYEYYALYTDGTHVKLVIWDGVTVTDNIKYTLIEEGEGYLIKSKIVAYNKDQYLNIHSGNLSVYSLNASASKDNYTFSFKLVSEKGDNETSQVYTDGTNSVTLYPDYSLLIYEVGDVYEDVRYTEADGTYSFNYNRGRTVTFTISNNVMSLTDSELGSFTLTLATDDQPSGGEEETVTKGDKICEIVLESGASCQEWTAPAGGKLYFDFEVVDGFEMGITDQEAYDNWGDPFAVLEAPGVVEILKDAKYYLSSSLGENITIIVYSVVEDDQPGGGDQSGEDTGTDQPGGDGTVTVSEALASAVDTDVVITGTVSEIKYAWSDSNKNMSINLTDDSGTIYVFKLATHVSIGDVITLTGKVGEYNNSKQIAAGATAVVVTAHVCSDWNDATCIKGQICKVCGLEKADTALGHVDEDNDGKCDRCTLSLNSNSVTFAMAGSTGTLASDSKSITWVNGDFTVTGYKGSSSTAIRTQDGDHFRVYKDSYLTISAGNEKKILKVVITTISNYKIEKSYVATSGVTTTVDGVTCTIVSTDGVAEIQVNAVAQYRVVSIEIIYA